MSMQESVVVGRVHHMPTPRPPPSTGPHFSWHPSPFGVGATGFFRIVRKVAQKEGWFRALVNDGTLLYPLYHVDMESAATALGRFIKRHSQPMTVEQAADHIEGIAAWLRRVAGKPKPTPAHTPTTQPRPKRDIERELEALRSLFENMPGPERVSAQEGRTVADLELLTRLWASAPDVSKSFPTRRAH